MMVPTCFINKCKNILEENKIYKIPFSSFSFKKYKMKSVSELLEYTRYKLSDIERTIKTYKKMYDDCKKNDPLHYEHYHTRPKPGMIRMRLYCYNR